MNTEILEEDKEINSGIQIESFTKITNILKESGSKNLYKSILSHINT